MLGSVVCRGPVYLSLNASSRFKELIELFERKEINLVKRRSGIIPSFVNSFWPCALLQLGFSCCCITCLRFDLFTFILAAKFMLWCCGGTRSQWMYILTPTEESLNAGTSKLSPIATLIHWYTIAIGFCPACYHFDLVILTKENFIHTRLHPWNEYSTWNEIFRQFTVFTQ